MRETYSALELEDLVEQRRLRARIERCRRLIEDHELVAILLHHAARESDSLPLEMRVSVV